MITKHTPGPWTIHKDYSRANYTVFDADGNYGDTSVETIDANAALIAAAPDLLAALKNLADESLKVGNALSRMGQGATALGLAEHKARLAIAKATGIKEQ